MFIEPGDALYYTQSKKKSHLTYKGSVSLLPLQLPGNNIIKDTELVKRVIQKKFLMSH